MIVSCEGCNIHHSCHKCLADFVETTRLHLDECMNAGDRLGVPIDSIQGYRKTAVDVAIDQWEENGKEAQLNNIATVLKDMTLAVHGAAGDDWDAIRPTDFGGDTHGDRVVEHMERGRIIGDEFTTMVAGQHQWVM